MTPQPCLSRLRSVIVLAAGILSLLVATLPADLLRDGLHVGCSYLEGGDVLPGWICGDGVGLLLPGLAVVAVPALALLAGVVLTLVRPAAPTARRVLVVLAAASAVVPPLAMVAVVHGEAGGVEAWWRIVAPACAAAIIGAGLGIASASVRRGVVALLVAAAVALVVAGLLQPGLAPAHVIAVGLLTASAPPRRAAVRRRLPSGTA